MGQLMGQMGVDNESKYPPEVEEALRRARLAMHGFVQVDQSQIDQYQT
jgi:hypothetical protein